MHHFGSISLPIQLIKRRVNTVVVVEADRSLLKCRASGLGEIVQDGYTPLMAAARANNVDVAGLIMGMEQTMKGCCADGVA